MNIFSISKEIKKNSMDSFFYQLDDFKGGFINQHSFIIEIGEQKMVYCSDCGKKNDNDAQYCTKCGNYIAQSSSLEKNIEKAAEEFGKKAEEFGKHLEKRARKFAKSMEESFGSPSKNCIACGTKLEKYAKFCWKCGKKID